MNKRSIIVLAILSLVIMVGCEKDSIKLSNIDDVKLKVSFNRTKSAEGLKNANAMTSETPDNYYVGLKSAKLLGVDGTSDVELFNEPDLSSSFVFDFADDLTTHSLLKDADIPDGEYSSIEIEIYYLQMNIAMATGERGVERRNIRIYLSDDAETESGAHQPGDMTQINEDVEIGWLLGNGQIPNMDPVSPREAAYATQGENSEWFDFAGKPAEHYGPFGDLDFMNNTPHPIYSTKVNFDFKDNGGTELILDFDVNNCWQFEDKSGDGVFGADDLDPLNPTRWHMALPAMTLSLQ